MLVIQELWGFKYKVGFPDLRKCMCIAMVRFHFKMSYPTVMVVSAVWASMFMS